MKAARSRRAARAPLPVPAWIASKRDGGELPDAAIRALIGGATDGSVPDYQLSALLMAIVWRGLSPRELATWLDAMVNSGDRMDLRRVPGVKVDKHSTGGVGDKISLALAPLVAACGVPVPMMSGRSLGHTGGTLDKLDAIPGFEAALSPRAFERVLAKTGLVLAGQSPRLAPADRRLYALRDATATVESIPLIASSIPSLVSHRKAAVVTSSATDKVGGAFDTFGRAVGNACELAEAIDILRGGGPDDARALTIRLGAEMLVLGRRARDRAAGARHIEAAIASGAGLEKLRACVALQGGDVRVIDDPGRLARAPREHVIRAGARGFVTRIDAGEVGRAMTLLGAGRVNQDSRIDPGVGILLHHKQGDAVDRGDVLAVVSFADPARLTAVRARLEGAFTVGPKAPPRAPLILEVIA